MLHGDIPNPSGLCMCGCGGKAPIAKRTDRNRHRVKGEALRYISGHNARSARANVPEPNPSGFCLCGCGQPTKPALQTDTKRGMVKGKPQRYLRGHHPHPPPQERKQSINPSGLCFCGCGQTTPLSTRTRGNQYKGEHTRYVAGHQATEKYNPDRIVVNPTGLCLCGCGLTVKRSDRIRYTSLGVVHKGEFYPYRQSHTEGRAYGRTDAKGYKSLYLPDHELADKPGNVSVHRLVMYEAGVDLDNRHVHHINGIKDDNRLENLMVVNSSEHRHYENRFGHHDAGICYVLWAASELKEAA